MDWHARLGSKLVSLEEAIAHVRTGATVGIAPFTTTPATLCGGLAAAARAGRVSHLQIQHLAALFPWTEPALQGRVRLLDNYATPANRAACHRGEMDYLPIGLWRSHALPDGVRPDPDVFFVPVSPPDAAGFCSFGTGVWMSPLLVAGAKCVVAEVQEDFIRTGGENFVHVDQIDWFVEIRDAGGIHAGGLPVHGPAEHHRLAAASWCGEFDQLVPVAGDKPFATNGGGKVGGAAGQR
jgi:4-hydroxybutyrate CoA-transferase